MNDPIFFNRLHTVEGGPGRIELTEILRFRDSRGRIWSVEQGFSTDFASYPKLIPGLLRLLMPSKLQNDKSAVIHDWAYSQAGENVWYTMSGSAAAMPQLMTKDFADWLFRDAMLAELPAGQKWKRWLPWLGVVVGGFFAWNRHYNRNAGA